MSLFLFLMGDRPLRVPEEQGAALLELCRRRGFVYRDLSFEEGTVCIHTTSGTAKKLQRAAASAGISLTPGELGGLPGALLRYRRRVGLALGMLLFCFMLFASTQVLWDIRVEGNRQLSDAQVEERLRECGFFVGSSLRGLNTAVLENRILIYSEEIAWISINMKGTVAHVVIRETVAKEEELTEADGVNLVAERGGEILWLEEVRGNVAVKSGDEVAEGDLLVGGIFAKEDGPLRYTRAEGKVMALTQRSFALTVPLTYEKKEYTGREKIEKYLIFFEKEVKFFTNAGNWDTTCDTIDIVEYFGLTEDTTLPIGIRTVRHREYRTVSVTRTEAEASALARETLYRQMEEEVPDGSLVRKTIREERVADGWSLWCDARFLEDIAKPVKIEIQWNQDVQKTKNRMEKE